MKDNWKQRQRGQCEDCGGETRYNDKTPTRTSRRCRECAPKARPARPRATARRLHAMLAKTGELRYGEVRDLMGITNDHAGVLLHNEMRKGRIVRVRRGVYNLPPA